MSRLVGIDEFLAKTPSLGPLESVSGRTEFQSHEAADLDVKFLLALLRQGHRVARTLCVPDFVACGGADGVEFVPRRCSPKGLVFRARAGVLVTQLHSTPRLWIPDDLADLLGRCERAGKRFVVLNFGIYPSADLRTGHANALIFDLQRRTIERYEPSNQTNASFDRTLSKLFTRELDGWRWNGAHTSAGGQEAADSFDGMCVTFSLMYVLLRLLNPDAPPSAVRRYIVHHSRKTLRDDILRLNRFAADTLRRYARGSLVRRSSSASSPSFAQQLHTQRVSSHDRVFVRRGAGSPDITSFARQWQRLRVQSHAVTLPRSAVPTRGSAASPSHRPRRRGRSRSMRTSRRVSRRATPRGRRRTDPKRRPYSRRGRFDASTM